MFLKKDVLFNIVVITVLLVACSYNCYQEELFEETKALSPISHSVIGANKYEAAVYYDIPLDQEQQDYVIAKCKEKNIDVELVLAVMKVESNYKFDVVSSTNDYGVMQINKINHKRLKKELNINDFLNFYDNTKAGIHILSQYKWCENEKQMLMCYNMGAFGAKRLWKKGIYETAYTKKVLKARKEIGEKKYEVKILCGENT